MQQNSKQEELVEFILRLLVDVVFMKAPSDSHNFCIFDCLSMIQKLYEYDGAFHLTKNLSDDL